MTGPHLVFDRQITIDGRRRKCRVEVAIANGRIYRMNIERDGRMADAAMSGVPEPVVVRIEAEAREILRGMVG